MFKQVAPVLDTSVRALCRRPYAGHPKGCPNWDKKPGCPPQARVLEKILDLSKPVYAIWNKFDLGTHRAKMLAKHPDWSERQLVCCLYWQGTARKQLKSHVSDFLAQYPSYHVLTCPEACGVNITTTMANIGVELEWPPTNTTYQVALAGVKL